MSYTQRETPILVELCTFLVEDMYGELASRVFSVLARFGRQRRAEISKASYLNSNQISLGLVILTQQHLVFHSPSTEPVVFYDIDWQQSYALVRHAKIAHFVEERFDKKTANVVSNLLTLGHSSVADLREAYFASYKGEEGAVNGTKVNGSVNGVNGNGDTSKTNGTHREQDEETLGSPDELYAIIQTLMEHGWVIQVAEAQYLSAEDMHNVARQQALNDRWGGAVPTGIKDKDMLAHLIRENKRRMRDAWLEVPQFSSRKRKADDFDYGSNKRTKLNGGGQYGSTGGSESSAEDDLVIRVNPEKAAVAMRNEYLVSLVEQRISYSTARLYEIMLRSLEKNIPRCFEEYPDPPPLNVEDQPQHEPNLEHVVNAKDVAQRAKILNIDICNGLDPNAIARIVKNTTVGKDGVLSPAVDPSSLNFHERLELVEAHFKLLEDHPFRFVVWQARGQYRVDFDVMAKTLIQQEIENTVLARKSNIGMKLIRALKKKGKLDERQLCNTMMASPNDIRTIVNDLTVQGFVQTQEVPKVDRREAKLSLHLIWYDVQRAREKLLHDTYKGQVRILQRIAFERKKIQELLSKANRTDVAGNETKYLKQSELDDLKKWKEVQEKLLLQLSREDDLVAVLRDYCGPLLTA
ncbi:DNA directed RNA polymeras-like protein III subunit Rpc82 [Bimuria novae-zelandiae CBS 107.79]|uniref:DNA-directed RNA polymerase III subunit RPC3 n=1 Tax=Bimuria novae-zelandiae CBS 107.79 TaxID=1447943 RepID=A0A6A5UMI4_9PLEO|nr:DNA directed RNA polymeras-like protein III subunit Rpc82 [Bimuria novae-zelandiae CBS 107.79]